MDPQTDFPDLIEDLEVNIDDLTSALHPLLSSPLPRTASTLPLLDKAKLHILTAYAIESLLFSSLLASGINAKEHPVFRELARLKSYFGKIKDAEERASGGSSAAEQPKSRIDKDAAARFIRHGLAGNEKYDLERAERIAKEKARAALKARQVIVKFDEREEAVRMAAVAPKKRKVEEVEEEDDDESEEDAATSPPAPVQPAPEPAVPAEDSEEEDHVESENEEFYGPEASSPVAAPVPQPAQQAPQPPASDAMELDTPKNKKPRWSKKEKKEHKKRKHSTDNDAEANPDAAADDTNEPTPTSKADHKAARRAKKRAKQMSKVQSLGGMKAKGEELVLPERAPRKYSETFTSLLEGTFAEKKKEEKAKKGKKR